MEQLRHGERSEVQTWDNLVSFQVNVEYKETVRRQSKLMSTNHHIFVSCVCVCVSHLTLCARIMYVHIYMYARTHTHTHTHTHVH